VAVALRGSVPWRVPAPLGGDPAELADYGTVPPFSLVERSGGEIRSTDLAGSPWIANFIFTRCSGTCPALSAGMAKLQAAIGGRATMVSFSVDPRHDTPEVLSEYARHFGASERWLFVTGDVAHVRSLITQGFHLSATEADGPDDGSAITHSDRIALIDAGLHIRAYYIGTEDGWVERVVHDLDALGGQ
jgi:protein SCO1/2